MLCPVQLLPLVRKSKAPNTVLRREGARPLFLFVDIFEPAEGFNEELQTDETINEVQKFLSTMREF